MVAHEWVKGKRRRINSCQIPRWMTSRNSTWRFSDIGKVLSHLVDVYALDHGDINGAWQVGKELYGWFGYECSFDRD